MGFFSKTARPRVGRGFSLRSPTEEELCRVADVWETADPEYAKSLREWAEMAKARKQLLSSESN